MNPLFLCSTFQVASCLRSWSVPSAKTTMYSRKEAWDPVCHITVSSPCFICDRSLTNICRFVCAYRPFCRNGAVYIWKTRGNNLEDRNYHLWKPKMSFLGVISCLSPCLPPPLVAIDIIHIKSAGIALPDFSSKHAFFSFTPCVRCSISTLHPSPQPCVKICFKQEMCSYISFSFLYILSVIIHFHFPFLGNDTDLHSIKWTFANKPTLYQLYQLCEICCIWVSPSNPIPVFGNGWTIVIITHCLFFFFW